LAATFGFAAFALIAMDSTPPSMGWVNQRYILSRSMEFA
jgi:hypothetical protein